MTVKERLHRIVDELPETAIVGELLARKENAFGRPSDLDQPTTATLRKTPEEVRKGLDDMDVLVRSFDLKGPPLSDWAVSREAMYEGRE